MVETEIDIIFCSLQIICLLLFSVAGHYLMSYIKDVAVYSSTKFSVTAITEYFRELMRIQKLPIRVTVICLYFIDLRTIINIIRYIFIN